MRVVDDGLAARRRGPYPFLPLDTTTAARHTHQKTIRYAIFDAGRRGPDDGPAYVLCTTSDAPSDASRPGRRRGRAAPAED